MEPAIDLNDLDSHGGFEDIEVPANDNDNVPDGRYTAFVDHVEINLTKNNKRRLSWRLKIIGDSHVGRCLFTGHILETKQNLQWLKRDLTTCGVTLTNWSDLPNRLEDLLDMVLEVQVKTKGQYTNTYFRKKVELADGVNPRELAAAATPSNAAGAQAQALFTDEPPF